MPMANMAVQDDISACVLRVVTARVSQQLDV